MCTKKWVKKWVGKNGYEKCVQKIGKKINPRNKKYLLITCIKAIMIICIKRQTLSI